MDPDDDALYRALLTRDRRFDGQLFVAVKTTGIYCRPICPARTPKRQNVRFFPSAAAAQEAGFRPCLRCRPESSPDLAIWRGTSNTVSRALALIEGGALDDSRVEGLADRLGIGERQLRRLFDEHVGASPLAVAHTRRVLLAKQLIHDTRLPMSEVALAAGFRSVRRFNETFRKLYGRAPSSLRRSGGVDVSAAVAGDVKLRLPYRPPFDWDGVLAFLALRAIPGVEAVVGGVYARTVSLDGHRGVLFVEPGKGHFVEATVRFPRLDALPRLLARIRRVFDLAADPLAIDAHLARDPMLTPLVRKRPGLRLPGAWDAFELGARAILGQQISVLASGQLLGTLASRHGAPMTDARANALGLTHLFPEASDLAGADLSTLSGPRARWIAVRQLAEAMVADPSLLRVGRSLDEATAALCQLKGIGQWTAHYIAMRELREPDAFPSGDAALLRAFANRVRHPTTHAALLSRAERWRPWRAYGAAHLWASMPKARSRLLHTEVSEWARRRIA